MVDQVVGGAALLLLLGLVMWATDRYWEWEDQAELDRAYLEGREKEMGEHNGK